MNSVIPGNKKGQCFICQRYCQTEEHHIFGGPDRNASERNGLKVNLCYEHHQGTNGVHGKNGKGLMDYLHQTGQEVYEDRKMKYLEISMAEARDEFRKEFRHSYL